MKIGHIFRGYGKRDTRTYEVVFKKYYQPLVMFVVRHIGNEDVAKDIVQDIFFKLFESSFSCLMIFC